MFRITQNGMNRLDIELRGKMNSEEMQIALAWIPMLVFIVNTMDL